MSASSLPSNHETEQWIFLRPKQRERSSSSEDRPPSPSPKRQKVDNGAAALEKPTSPAENSKEIRTLEPPADPGECAQTDAQIDGAATADAKTDATTPIAEGSSPTLVADKPRAFVFFVEHIYQKQNPNVEASVPVCTDELCSSRQLFSRGKRGSSNTKSSTDRKA